MQIHYRMWLSLVERLLWEQDAAGSNPVIRTIQQTIPNEGSSAVSVYRQDLNWKCVFVLVSNYFLCISVLFNINS